MLLRCNQQLLTTLPHWHWVTVEKIEYGLAWLGNKYSDRDYLAILSAGFWLRCPEAIKKSKSQFKQLNRNQICGKLPTHEVNQYSDIWPQWLLWSNDAGSVGRGGNRSWQGRPFLAATTYSPRLTCPTSSSPLTSSWSCMRVYVCLCVCVPKICIFYHGVLNDSGFSFDFNSIEIEMFWGEVAEKTSFNFSSFFAQFLSAT